MIDSFDHKFSFLSNSFPAPIRDKQGTIWKTSEHAYQAMKTVDPGQKRTIMLAETPGIAKRMGLRVTLRPGWDAMKLEVMEAIVKAKFEQHPDLRLMLLATGNEILLEGNNWHDNFWGDCACPSCQKRPGKNHLGRILMRIRDNL